LFKQPSKIFMGFDLAANPLRPTGWAVVDESLRIYLEPEEVFSDEEILDRVREFQPQWIGIDAPLSFPGKERKTRLCDRELRRFGSPTLPPVLIASLTRRSFFLDGEYTFAGEETLLFAYTRCSSLCLYSLLPLERKLSGSRR